MTQCGESCDLRKDNSQRATRHAIRLPMLLHPMQMQRQCPQRSIIRIRQRIDNRMQTIPPDGLITNLRRLNELSIMLIREQRVLQFAEEELE